MIQIVPDKDVVTKRIQIGKIPAIILTPAIPRDNAPGILWIHGGGYRTGMKEMVYFSRAMNLVKRFGCVVIAPGYRLSWQAPYPAAIMDCYKALVFLKRHAEELGVRKDQIMVGGESAGGGLCAAVCMLAHDKGEVNVAFQMPLYPMLSNIDTDSSIENHGHVWNTRKNHAAWKLYLGDKAEGKVSAYASPSWRKDYTGLPPAYTFVGDGEPFYDETLAYIKNLQEAGIPAEVDVYHTDVHAFDMLLPHLDISQKAIDTFEEKFLYAMQHYFAENESAEIGVKK